MKRIITFLCATIGYFNAAASGIVVSNVSMPTQNTTEKFRMVKLDVVWQNSWRTYNHERNYDAAWVFIKFRKLSDYNWKHATLNYVNGVTDGHVKVTNCEINTPSDGKGVFVYRATATSNFIGTATYRNIQLRWNYGADGIGDNEMVEIAVFAIEMVYIPEGAFYLGDGSTDL